MIFRKNVGLHKRFIVDMMPAGQPAERFYNLIYRTLGSLTEFTGDNPKLFSVEMEFIESL